VGDRFPGLLAYTVLIYQVDGILGRRRFGRSAKGLGKWKYEKQPIPGESHSGHHQPWLSHCLSTGFVINSNPQMPLRLVQEWDGMYVFERSAIVR
jgi:hypothetical protein